MFPFVGWDNYQRIFDDPLFLLALKNTLIFTAFSVTAEIVLAIAIALLINQTACLDITHHASPDPAALCDAADRQRPDLVVHVQLRIWLSQPHPVHPRAHRCAPVNWAGNPATALYAVAVPYIWRTLPFAILLIHAALQGISEELYEAAAVDGAGAWQRFRHITLPLLQPIIVVILVLRTSFAFAVFEEILAITQGGPGDATWVAAWYSYRNGFSPPFDIGVGAASAYVLAMIVGLYSPSSMSGFIYRRTQLMLKPIAHRLVCCCISPTLLVISFFLLPLFAVLIGSAAVGENPAGRYAGAAAGRMDAGQLSA